MIVRVLLNGFVDLIIGGIEYLEFLESGFCVKLDNFGIVVNDGDWVVERGVGYLVVVEIDVFLLY